MAHAISHISFGENVGVETTGVQKLKRSGMAALWTAQILRRDEHGLWLAAPAGTRVRWIANADTEETIAAHNILVLIPKDDWWVASWWGNGDITIDICVPCYERDGVWTFEDLELDLFRSQSGSHGVVDVDEFLAACADSSISKQEKELALAAAGAGERRLRDKIEPFGDLGWQYFAEAKELQMAPLEPPAI